MAFDDIYLVSDRTKTAMADEVAAAEASLGVKLPGDYVDFVSRFGEGSISNWVRVYGPGRVAAERDERREGLKEYYFWDEGADVLSREQVHDAVTLADTFNGDEIVYRASEPAGFFALPRDEEGIYPIGQTLEEAIDWLCTSGTLTGALALKAFEPLDDRERRRFLSSDGTTYEAVRDAFLALGLHDLASDATEGDDKCYDLFYREFGGSATILEGDDGAGVILKSDAEASGSKLHQVVATLTGLGLEER